jgi:hypothetical protein
MLTKGGHKNYCFVKRYRYSLPVTVARYGDHILENTSNGVTGKRLCFVQLMPK